jgi:hypothetical protein
VNEHFICRLRRLRPLACILTILTLRKVGTTKVEQNMEQDLVSRISEANGDVDAEETIKGTHPSVAKVVGGK